jgi:hypothetical protein
VSQYQEQGKLIRAPQALTVLGQDLFGDKVNLYTGALDGRQTAELPIVAGDNRIFGDIAAGSDSSGTMIRLPGGF